MKTILLFAIRRLLFAYCLLALTCPALATDGTILAVGGGDAPLMLKIIFWLLLILWLIGALGFHDNPTWVRGQGVVLIILFAILGYYTFGF